MDFNALFYSGEVVQVLQELLQMVAKFSFHNNDVTDTTAITAQIDVCLIAYAYNIKVPHYWPFVRENHRWPVDSPHARSVYVERVSMPCRHHVSRGSRKLRWLGQLYVILKYDPRVRSRYNFRKRQNFFFFYPARSCSFFLIVFVAFDVFRCLKCQHQHVLMIRITVSPER